MRTYITWIVFLGFVLLCGAEILPKFIRSAQKEGRVLYVRGTGQTPEKQISKAEPKDYKKLVEGINVNGA